MFSPLNLILYLKAGFTVMYLFISYAVMQSMLGCSPAIVTVAELVFHEGSQVAFTM